MKRILLIVFLVVPGFVHAEGQAGLSFFLDAIYLFVVLMVWGIVTLISIEITKKFRALNRTNKLTISGTTLTIALVYWGMTKYDPYPYDGPIDTIFKSYPKVDPNAPKPDGTIEYILSSIDSTKEGSYIWLNDSMIYVRPLTEGERNHEGLNDELTKSIVKTWK